MRRPRGLAALSGSVVLEALSERFDFFFEFQLLALHRRQLHVVRGRTFGFIFNDKIKFPVAGVEFTQPLLDGH
jgi:hypothetical protein